MKRRLFRQTHGSLRRLPDKTHTSSRQIDRREAILGAWGVSVPVLLLLVLFLLVTIAAARADEGIIFHQSFDDEGGTLRIENDDAQSAVVRRFEIPAADLAGKAVTLEVRLKADDVSQPPNHWNGVKAMLVVQTESGATDHPQIRFPRQTIPWSTARHTVRLPSDLARLTLALGLEKVSGRVWFDEVSLRVGRRPAGEVRRGNRFQGHELPALRGVMVGPKFVEENIRDLARWNVNQVRWQLNWTPMKRAETWAADLEAYDTWLDGALENAEQAIEACRRHNILVLLDLHCPPGGRREGGVMRMLEEPRYQKKFLEVWHQIATRFQGCEQIYAYDLINEPTEPPLRPQGLLSWPELAAEATKIIRRIDPGKPVVFEPGPWGSCNGFDQMIPLDLDRVIYSFHMYQPHAFTHQFKMTDRYPDGVVYPGEIDGVYWDKARLRESMRPALDFQREFNVHMYVGEFSAIRWAPQGSAYRYLRDVIEIMEEEGWDWSYHAFREFHGWSVEHSTNEAETAPSPTATDRQQLLQKWFTRNRRPER